MGNLNVFVPGTRPVERHVAPIKLDRRRRNLALFCIGGQPRDTYTFSFESGTPGWKAEIQGIDWDTPVTLSATSLPLGLEAPPDVVADRVTVWVERASTAERVPVEFELGTVPDGAACYQL